MINSISSSLKKYVDFQGRATRKEFWIFVAFVYASAFIGGLIDGLAGTDFIGSLVVLVLTLPYLAVAVRRMHDVGKAGWFILVPFYNLILACTASLPTEANESQSKES
jgi:uncharacterized membrane protein YhaH (DUF805 family)